MKILPLLALLFLFALPAEAQNITASGTTCATSGACVSQGISNNQGGATIQLAGTFSATLQFEATNAAQPFDPANSASWTSIAMTPLAGGSTVTSATAVGTWQTNIAGLTAIRVRCSTYASGTVVVTIQLSLVAAVQASSGSGSGQNSLGSAFYFTNSCAGQSNCFQGVDDDSTDNCGTALTTWMNAVNSYSSNGSVEVFIIGSGTGKAYKLASCNLIFSGPNVANVHDMDIHLAATLDCQQSNSFANCIQLGVSGLSNYNGNQSISHRFGGGGTILGCTNVTHACIESEPYMLKQVLYGFAMINTGAGNATAGSCTNYSLQFDGPVAEPEISRTYGTWNASGPTGVCVSNNSDPVGGNNTIRMYGNHWTTSGSPCGSIAHTEAGSHSAIFDNSLYGFDIPMLFGKVTGATFSGGWMVSGNSLDNAGCLPSTGTAAPIQFGLPGASTTVGPATFINNEVPGGSGHETAFMAINPAATSAPLQGISFIGNMAQQNAISLMSPNTITCATMFGATGGVPCYIGTNSGMSFTTTGFVTNQCGGAGASWQQQNILSSCAAGGQAANISGNALITPPTVEGMTIACQVFITQQATTSSTLPTCGITYTDFTTNTTQTVQVTPTLGASATVGCSGTAVTDPAVGTSCAGLTGRIIPKAGTTVSYTTSGYASVGGTPMQYQVAVTASLQ
jgi:hypothetical protein